VQGSEKEGKIGTGGGHSRTDQTAPGLVEKASSTNKKKLGRKRKRTAKGGQSGCTGGERPKMTRSMSESRAKHSFRSIRKGQKRVAVGGSKKKRQKGNKAHDAPENLFAKKIQEAAKRAGRENLYVHRGSDLNGTGQERAHGKRGGRSLQHQTHVQKKGDNGKEAKRAKKNGAGVPICSKTDQ